MLPDSMQGTVWTEQYFWNREIISRSGVRCVNQDIPQRIEKFGELIYSVNLRIQSEYRKIRTRKNSVFVHCSRSVKGLLFWCSDYCNYYLIMLGSQHSGRPGKSGKNMKKLKNKGKLGKLKKISWTIKVFSENSDKIFTHLINLLIL